VLCSAMLCCADSVAVCMHWLTLVGQLLVVVCCGIVATRAVLYSTASISCELPNSCTMRLTCCTAGSVAVGKGPSAAVTD